MIKCPLTLSSLLALLLLSPASQAIQIVTATSTNYNTSDNIGSSVTNWSTGWGTGNTNDGWNYTGLVTVSDGYGSGIYLGDGWVLTAGHVGVGTFDISGNTYNSTGLSFTDFTNSLTGTSNADLTLFQISTTSLTGNPLSLLSLTIASNAPTAFSATQAGSQVVMIGYGGLGEKSWGVNTVTSTGLTIPVSGYNFDSVDFLTAYGVTSYTNRVGRTRITNSITNNAQVYPGDSGGADFINVSGRWELAGVNEAVGTGTNNLGDSYLVQLSAYDAQITAIMASVPEPSALVLLGGGLIVLLMMRRKFLPLEILPGNSADPRAIPISRDDPHH